MMERYKAIVRLLNARSGGNRVLQNEVVRLRAIFDRATTEEEQSHAMVALEKLARRAWAPRY
jgi:hypothetical protein